MRGLSKIAGIFKKAKPSRMARVKTKLAGAKAGGKKQAQRLVDFTKAHPYGVGSGGLVGFGAAAGGSMFLRKTKKNRKVQGVKNS